MSINDLKTCEHCGGYHTTTCQRIRAIEYNLDGTVKRVEFHAPAPINIDALRVHPHVATVGGHTASVRSRP